VVSDLVTELATNEKKKWWETLVKKKKTHREHNDVANQPLSLVREVVAIWWKTKISKEVNEIKNNHKEKLRMETNLYLAFLVPSQEYYLHWKVHLPVRHLG